MRSFPTKIFLQHTPPTPVLSITSDEDTQIPVLFLPPTIANTRDPHRSSPSSKKPSPSQKQRHRQAGNHASTVHTDHWHSQPSEFSTLSSVVNQLTVQTKLIRMSYPTNVSHSPQQSTALSSSPPSTPAQA